MFQTIGYKGGFVQIATFGNNSRIEAFSHGERLGPFKSVSGAKCAITRAHKQWVRDFQAECAAYRQSI